MPQRRSKILGGGRSQLCSQGRHCGWELAGSAAGAGLTLAERGGVSSRGPPREAFSEPFVQNRSLPHQAPPPCLPHYPLTQLMFNLMIFKSFFKLWYNTYKMYHFNHIKVHRSVVLSTFTKLCTHHLSSSRTFALLPKQPHLH